MIGACNLTLSPIWGYRQRGQTRRRWRCSRPTTSPGWTPGTKPVPRRPGWTSPSGCSTFTAISGTRRASCRSGVAELHDWVLLPDSDECWPTKNFKVRVLSMKDRRRGCCLFEGGWGFWDGCRSASFMTVSPSPSPSLSPPPTKEQPRAKSAFKSVSCHATAEGGFLKRFDELLCNLYSSYGG